jgi:hypothetical protein
MTSPFLPWLPMYAPRSLAERPWWTLSLVGWRRADGFSVQHGLGGALGAHGGEWAEHAGVPTWRCGRKLFEGVDPSDMMARLDAEHPMAAPPPMCGQVWVWTNGWERMVVGVDRCAVFGCGDEIRNTGAPSEYSDIPMRADVWPPPSAVLVAGPTPWGRDVPWAPPGWKP